MLISNNKFIGTAPGAIIADFTYYMTVLGDNINHLNSSSGYPIVLLENTSNCTVIGNTKDNVDDLGTDNILTGVTRTSNPVGPEIREALKERPKLMHPNFYPEF